MFEIILALYEALLLEPPPSSTKTVIFAFNPPNVLGVQIQIGVDRVVIKELGKCCLFLSIIGSEREEKYKNKFLRLEFIKIFLVKLSLRMRQKISMKIK